MFTIVVALAVSCSSYSDWYYPQEEAAERAALQVPTFRGAEGPDVLLAARDAKQPTRVPRQGDFHGWRVAETLDKPEPIVVLEHEAAHWGLIVFLGKRGVVAEVRKAVGRLDAICEPRADFPKDYFDRLLGAKADVLGQKVLASGGDPSYEAVAGLLAPLVSYTLLGSPESAVKYAVQPDGSIGVLPNRWGIGKPLEKLLFDPENALPEGVYTAKPIAAKRGLLGGYLPAIDYGLVARQGGPPGSCPP